MWWLNPLFFDKRTASRLTYAVWWVISFRMIRSIFHYTFHSIWKCPKMLLPHPFSPFIWDFPWFYHPFLGETPHPHVSPWFSPNFSPPAVVPPRREAQRSAHAAELRSGWSLGESWDDWNDLWAMIYDSDIDMMIFNEFHQWFMILIWFMMSLILMKCTVND